MNNLFNFYKGKKVLITGHTGFKGSWLSSWLINLGANVTGISLGIPTKPSNFVSSELFNKVDDYRFDISNYNKLNNLIQLTQPNIIFHLAAQALVRKSYDNPIKTISSNLIGTVNLLESLRNYNNKITVVMITSDKVYENIESSKGYKENDRLGGKDLYSASKSMAELAINSYFQSYFNISKQNIKICIARAGNVIGGGDWAKDRIVPDCIKAWSKNLSVDIRYPRSTRPWQHVLEPLSGYLSLGAILNNKTNIHGQAFNFGPKPKQNKSVQELISEMSKNWTGSSKWKDISLSVNHLPEAGLLSLNCDKAKKLLNWEPVLNFQETIKLTVDWYKNFYSYKQTYPFMISQINNYTELAKKRSLAWASKSKKNFFYDN